MSEPKTEREAMKMAWHALMRGDLAERDRLCDLARKLFDEEERLLEILGNDPLGTQ